ncbi:XRE family transcriptional regulator [Providencia rettgeri]|uniref:helix-turn-helix domain-containing protein n=1 Tax=Providencia rettgeri TaxID=587 RepID=UPI00101112CE|nr:helix-turn-helix transcriptional regulator [Providencia rettgeri]RXN69655.1 XRE family transcriptional regulator [Providencia rettgeri]
MKEGELLLFFIGKKIKHYRLTCGLSGYNLGRKIGVSQQQISRYENGVSSLSFHMLNKILLSLNLDDSEIDCFFDEFKNYFYNNEYKNKDL